MNRLEFTAYLRHTLIPDFRAADMDATAGDFLTCMMFITQDVEALHDARKALLAASAHIPVGANAAALVAASLKEIDEILGYPAPAPVKRETSPQSRRCLDLKSNLHD